MRGRPRRPAGPQARWSRRSRCAILRRRGDLIITETRHGFVCANAGVDLSNVDAGYGRPAAGRLRPLGPAHPRRPAGPARRRGRRDRLRHLRPDLAAGVTDVAIGCAGVAAVVDLRGTTDAYGRELEVTEVCVADELAAAAELVMGKAAASRWRSCGASTRLAARVVGARPRSSAARPRTCSAEPGRCTSVPARQPARRTARGRRSRRASVHGFQPRWMAARPGSRRAAAQLAGPGRAVDRPGRRRRPRRPWSRRAR